MGNFTIKTLKYKRLIKGLLSPYIAVLIFDDKDFYLVNCILISSSISNIQLYFDHFSSEHSVTIVNSESETKRNAMGGKMWVGREQWRWWNDGAWKGINKMKSAKKLNGKLWFSHPIKIILGDSRAHDKKNWSA